MIGSGLRKYARQRGLRCDQGFAYGAIDNRLVVLDEGAGFKRLRIYLHPANHPDAETDARALSILSDCDRKAYRLKDRQYAGVQPLEGNESAAQAVQVGGGFAQILFWDNPGTLKCMIAYMDEMLPRLEACPAGRDACAHCGEDMEGYANFVQLGGDVLPMHDRCVRALLDEAAVARGEEKQGSVALGAIGALLGAVLGAVPTALVFYWGYIASVCGFLIGLFSDFFYRKLGGRQGRARVAIVLFMVILGVAMGQVGGYTLIFMEQYDGSHGLTLAEDLRFCWEELVLYDQETALGIEYDRALAELNPSDMEDIMTREEFIETYYDAEIEATRSEILGEFWRNSAVSLLFAMLACLGLFARLRDPDRRYIRELK